MQTYKHARILVNHNRNESDCDITHWPQRPLRKKAASCFLYAAFSSFVRSHTFCSHEWINFYDVYHDVTNVFEFFTLTIHYGN